MLTSTVCNMSDTEILWSIYYEVMQEFPTKTEDQHIEITNERYSRDYA